MSATFSTAAANYAQAYSGPTTASGNITLATRVNLTNITAAYTFIAAITGTTGLFRLWFDFSATPNKAFGAAITNDAETVFGEAIDTVAAVSGTWFHLAGTWDGTSVRFYKDGALIATNTPASLTRAGNWATICSPSNATGAAGGGGVGGLVGSIQDSVWYNAALTLEEIQQLYRQRMPARRANLMAWNPFITLGATKDYSGITGGVFTLTSTAPTAGPGDAGVPWGTPPQQPWLRMQPSRIAALSGNMLETATLVAAAAGSGSSLGTGGVKPGSGLLASLVDTAAAVAGAVLTASIVETGVLLPSANIATITANIVETALMLAAAAGSGSSLGTGGVLPGAGLLGVIAQNDSENAVASLSGNELQTALLAIASVLTGSSIQTASLTAAAAIAASILENASMAANGALVSSISGTIVETAVLFNTVGQNISASTLQTANMTAVATLLAAIGGAGAAAPVAALVGAQSEAGSVASAAALLARLAQASSVGTGGTLSGGGASGSGAGATASLLASIVEFAFMQPPGSGGGGNHGKQYTGRRPVAMLIRRPSRFSR